MEPFDYDPALQFHAMPEEYTKSISHAGQVIKETYDGPQGTNTLYVYLPPDYDANQKYNIFYLLHGGNENENTLFHQSDTMLQYIFDNMIERGDMELMIVVTPTWNQTSAEGFWSEYRERVVPFVESKYSTYAETTDLAGLQKNEYFIFCATGTNDIAYENIGPQVEEMKKMSQFVYTSDLSQGNFYFLVANGYYHIWAQVRHYVYNILPYFFHEGQ